MRGFGNTRGISGRLFATNILILFAIGAALFSSGCSGLVSAPGGGNPVPLAISNVAAASATPTSIGIDWQTNVPANSQIEYGTTTSYGSTTTVDSTMVTSHQLSVSSLQPGTAYHCRVHSTDAKNNSAVSGDLGCSTSKDITAPTVSITSPAANATLSGTVTLTADASDNVAVANVQFKVDNANTGVAITAAPYSYALNTTTLSDGNHILTAVATDTSRNTATSTGVPVKVNNATLAPSITSLNPTSGLVGTSVTIAGANFGATQGTSTVTFNGTAATATSWSATSIVVPVPAGATTGNVVVTVSGVASNGLSFTVTADTTAPVVTVTAPANNATVSGAITLTATATDPDSPVSFVQFVVDGTNTGAQLTASPYSISLDTTTLSNSTHALTAVAQDPAGNKGTSAAVTITVSNSAGTGATGPLRALAGNAHYFTDGSGKAILLTGSHTWDTFQDLDMSASPRAFDFTAYVNFLKSHGHNVTILWRKDLPTYCNWGAGGTWHVKQFPWKRTGGSSGTQVASDGLPAFDLTQLDQTYFDRLRSSAMQLQQNGIYADVELFDGLGLVNNRCSNDGYPFTGGNNVNGVDDGGGTNSMTMSARNSITDIQEAYVKKVIDTLNDLPNVLWEISEEAPTNSTWWQAFMIDLLHAYEGGGTLLQTGEVFSAKAFKHPVHYPTLQYPGNDSALPNSRADVVSPTARISGTSTCGTGTPPCKVNINDSDHSYYGMWNDSAQTNRNYVWENFANGNQVIFMDPYLIYWTTGNRNLCQSPSNGVCTGPDSRWNNMRDNLGYTLSYANKMDLAKMTPQGGLSSTGFCLADNVATGAEYLVYAPNGGTFTVNLGATTQVLNVEWFNPATGATTAGAAITGGSTKSFTAPFSGDAVLYIVDAAGHN